MVDMPRDFPVEYRGPKKKSLGFGQLAVTVVIPFVAITALITSFSSNNTSTTNITVDEGKSPLELVEELEKTPEEIQKDQSTPTGPACIEGASCGDSI